MKPQVFHINHCPKDAVYIGRPSKFGNPFVIGIDGTRREVIAKYKDWIYDNPELLQQIKDELKGKHLSCWCKPKECHGDILLEIANPNLSILRF